MLTFSAIVSLIVLLAWRKRTKWIINIIGRRAWYRNYYTLSPSWRFARRIKLFLSGRKCARCKTKFMLDVHHKQYEVFGLSILYWEWLFPWMLKVLCRSCHEIEHG